MHVSDVGKIINISPSQSAAPDKSDGPGSFRQIYQGTLEGVSPAGAVAGQDAKADLLDQGNRVLDLLDAYATELDNPQKTLKEIDPLARAIEKEVGIFGEKRAGHPEIDAEMDGLAEALEITANVAMLKFRRGDYL